MREKHQTSSNQEKQGSRKKSLRKKGRCKGQEKKKRNIKTRTETKQNEGREEGNKTTLGQNRKSHDGWKDNWAAAHTPDTIGQEIKEFRDRMEKVMGNSNGKVTSIWTSYPLWKILTQQHPLPNSVIKLV